jgi:hypothetical protein
MSQLQLFPEVDVGIEESALQRRFLLYHEANPHVYGAVRVVALSLRRKGWRQYGVGACFEVLRFHSDVQAVSDSWKLNNDYRSRYARLLMEQEPELAGFFSLRRLRS